jgi:metal-responsive CopG/Arc/MetJ family transcriptional regulator
MAGKRTHVVIPEEVVEEIDSLVGKRGRSNFLVRAAQTEVKRLPCSKPSKRQAEVGRTKTILNSGAVLRTGFLGSGGRMRNIVKDGLKRQ